MAESSVKLEFHASADAWMRTMQSTVRQLEAKVAKLRELNAEGRRSRNVFNDMTQSVSGFARGMGALSGGFWAVGGRAGLAGLGVAAATTAVRANMEMTNDTAQLLQRIAGEQLGLSTVARGALEHWQLDYLARQVGRLGGMEANQAIQFASDLQQVGATPEEILQLARLGRMSTDPLGIARTPFKLMTAFQMKERNLEGQISGIIEAARISEVKPETFTPELMSFAGAMQGLGGTWEESAGALSKATLAVKNVENAATYLRALATVIRRIPELRDLQLGLIGTVEWVAANWNEEQINQLNDVEIRATEGFNIVRNNLEEIKRIIALVVEAARSGRNIDEAIDTAASSPVSRGILARRKAEADWDATRLELYAKRAGVGKAVYPAYRSVLAKQGWGPWGSAALSFLPWAAGELGFPEIGIGLAGATHAALGMLYNPVDYEGSPHSWDQSPSDRARYHRLFHEGMTHLVLALRENTEASKQAAREIADAKAGYPGGTLRPGARE